MDMNKEILTKLATELAKRDREELCRLVSTMKFKDAYEQLNGYNPDNVGGDAFFDVNYKSIATTIYRTKRGGCEVHDSVDVWVEDICYPILQGVQP